MIIKVWFDIKESEPSLFSMKFEEDELVSNCLKRIAAKAMLKTTQEELQDKYALLLTNEGKYQYLPQDLPLLPFIDPEKIKVTKFHSFMKF